MTRFIEAHRGRFGVEPICRVMEFNPSTYLAARSRPPSDRSPRDEFLKPEIRRVHKENYSGSTLLGGWEEPAVSQTASPFGGQRVALSI